MWQNNIHVSTWRCLYSSEISELLGRGIRCLLQYPLSRHVSCTLKAMQFELKCINYPDIRCVYSDSHYNDKTVSWSHMWKSLVSMGVYNRTLIDIWSPQKCVLPLLVRFFLLMSRTLQNWYHGVFPLIKHIWNVLRCYGTHGFICQRTAV